MNPSNERHISQLRKAMRYSYQELEPHRSKSYDVIRQYTGRHYGDDGASRQVPIPLISLAADIYVHALASSSPAALVTMAGSGLSPESYNLSIRVNDLLKEIKFKRTLQRWVQNAILSFGVMKVGIESSGSLTNSFAETILIDNWVHDVVAHTLDRPDFAGNQYRIPYEKFMESDIYVKKARDGLQPTPKRAYNEDGSEKIETIEGASADPDEYRPYIDLWDVWLPDEGLILTISADERNAALRVVEWDGPDNGPFYFLRFNEVPGNAMPLPPYALWLDLHRLANRLFNRMEFQADREKNFLGVNEESERDGRNILATADGEAVTLADPNSAKEFHTGGVSPQTFALFTQVKDLFSWTAGNLDIIGGLGAASPTATQDKLLDANSSKRIESMQDEVTSITKDILCHLGWNEYTDPAKDYKLTKQFEGTDIKIPVTWTVEERQNTPFSDFEFDIIPYSMQDQSPQARLSLMQKIMETIIMPMQPMITAQNMGINFKKLMNMISRYAPLPELNDIVMNLGAARDTPGVPRQGGGTSNKVYERVSRPGATRGGKDVAQAMQAMGAKQQPSEAAVATMPVR